MENAKRDLKADYLNAASTLRPFHRHPFSPKPDYARVIKDRHGFPVDREALVAALLKQNEELPDNQITLGQIRLLKDPATFTVTTGHQLCLMGGPLYTVYKIATTIKLAQRIQSEQSDIRVVPVFWMATEDHDWEEVNHYFPDANKRVVYAAKCKGPVGRHVLEDSILSIWPDDLADELSQFYKPGKTLSDAYRLLIHRLFGKYGLVILDGDDAGLKKAFAPWMMREVGGKGIAHAVRKTNSILAESGYEPVAQTRDVNLFYLGHGGRSGILLEEDVLKIPDAGMTWTQEEAVKVVEEQPELFSPNVLLRPLYQEVVLPNLAYVGGWAEMAYWMQLLGAFESSCVAFPLLVPRMHGTLVTSSMRQEANALQFSPEEFKKPVNELWDAYLMREFDAGPLNEASARVLEAYQDLISVLEGIDPTLAISIRGEQAKASGSLDNLGKKVKKALRNKNPKPYARIAALKALVSPEQGSQERLLNFTAFGADHDRLVSELIDFCSPEHPQNEWIPLP